MNGIHAAFTGASARTPGAHRSRRQTLGIFPVAVVAKTDGDARRIWVRVALFGGAVGALAPRLTKGGQVVGRLILGTWTGEAKGDSTSRRGRSYRSPGSAPRQAPVETRRGPAVHTTHYAPACADLDATIDAMVKR